MSRLKAANNAQTTLAALMEAGATSCTVANGDILPATPFILCVDNEIMEVGAKSGNELSSILRGQEGTTATAHNAGTKAECRMTAGMYNELLGPGEGSTVKNKYDATTNPTVMTDSGAGYSVGSTWINITDDNAYVCLDATVGAAKWEQVSGLAAHKTETVSCSGILSRSSDVTTDLSVTTGFEPKWVQIQSTGDTGQYSNGQKAQTGASCMFRKPGGIITVHNGYISRLSNDGGTQVVQIACAFTDTGFTLSFENYSYPVTMLNMCYIAGTH